MLTQLWKGKARGTSRQSLRSYLYRPAPDVMTAVREGRVVLLDGRRERYFGLDEVGTSVWAGLEAGLTFTEIVDSLEGEYDAPREMLERDVSTFLSNLAESKLVVSV
jgi:hypothetical protein